MSATDELRRLLDERDIETIETSHDSPVIWKCANGHGAWARDYDGALTVQTVMTPQQAIDATLGHRTTTRHGKFRTKYGRSVPCCECCGYGIGDERWHYCPSCGAEVVDE